MDVPPSLSAESMACTPDRCKYSDILSRQNNQEGKT
jgi:hypothetical protein